MTSASPASPADSAAARAPLADRVSPEVKARVRMASRALLTLLACWVIALPFGILTAQAESSFGPHRALYSVTTDNAITADFGPLGSLVVPADELIPGRLGVHAEVGEIPVEYGMEGATIDALGGDVEAYAALFADPAAHARLVAGALVGNAALRTFVLGGVLFAGFASVRLLMGKRRRTALLTARPFQSEGSPRLLRAAGRTSPAQRLGAFAAISALGVTAGAMPVDREKTIRPDPLFDNTPLAGSQVTGRVSGIIDEAASAVVEMLADTTDFYGRVQTSLAQEWPRRPLSPRWSSEDAGLLGPVPARGSAAEEAQAGDEAPAEDAAAADGQAADGPAQEGAADAAPAEGAPAEESDIATIVWTSDIHCQTGMSSVIGDVIDWSGADLHIDGGDITMTGTEAENVCVDSLAGAVPDGVPSVFVKGNHDSEDTAARAAAVGWTVLEDQPVEVAGLTLLGSPDPRRTVFPSGDVLERGETGGQFTERVADLACAEEHDLLVIHDPRQAEQALARGCSDFALSGHWHRRVEPEQVGRGIRMVNSTTGGALADALTPGPLKMPAEMSIIRVDRVTGDPIDVQYVTVGMDAGVEFSEWVPFGQPRPLVEVLPTDESAPEEEAGETASE